MLISVQPNAVPDSYRVAAMGSDGTRSVSAAISLLVESDPPSSAQPQQPGDGETGVVEQPIFTWLQGDRAAKYRLEVFSGDACEGCPVRQFEDIEGTRFMVVSDGALSLGTTYSWRLVAQNACGDTRSQCSRFTTRQCSLPIDLISNGGFEDGFDAWSLNATGVQPVLSTEQAHSGIYSARLGLTGTPGSPELWQTVNIAADASHPRLVFWYLPAGNPFCIGRSCEERQSFVIRPDQPDRLIFLMRDISPPGDWTRREFSLEDFRGETIEVHFKTVSISQTTVRSAMYLDDVSVTYDVCEAR